VQVSDEGDVLLHRQPVERVKLLWDDADPIFDLVAVLVEGHSEHCRRSAGRRSEPLKHLDHRRLAGTVRAEEAENLPCFDFE